uniref:Uncharacterized protein n=1 Tax=Alexandrium catenella TaxID=2925 RepID=A0A7S1LQQ5_ALECA
MQRPLLAFGLCLLGGCLPGAGAAITGARGLRAASHRHRADAEIQLSLRTHLRAGAGGTAGFRLHRRREKVHIWSKPCRRLPLEKRSACERRVAAEVLKDSTWVLRRSGVKASAITVALQHD